MKPVIVTTSWDDGHKLDTRLAGLLKRYGIKATFYVSPRSHEFPASELLTAEEIRQLATDFEIGAHTMTHPRLAQLGTAAASREIADSKEALELITGKPLRSFCYPYGDYNEETQRLVREAGFDRARSVRRFTTRSTDQLAIGVAADCYDHLRDGMLSVLRLCGARPWRVVRLRRWDNLAKAMFAQARERAEVFHLIGHSHEIEAHGDWGRLEEFLSWLGQQRDVVFACNADVPPPPPRVLITAPYFKPHSGGLEEYAYQIAKGLQDTRNWQVSVVASGGRGEPELDSYHGIRVHRLRYRLRISNTPFGFGWSRALRRIIAAERPDAVVAHAPVPGMLDVTARRVKKTPFVVTYHMGSLVKGYGRLDALARCYERLVLPHALGRAQLIICSSAFVRRSPFLARYRDKTAVINPGVDDMFLAPPPHRAPGHRLMHVGGLKTGERHKGLNISLQVVAELKKSYPDVRLRVVGDGDRRAYYEGLAGQLGIAAQVEFCGRLAGQEMVAAYQRADVLIAPGHREAFGMVLVEAMACGVPVVATGDGGVPDVVDDGEVGFLVEPDDVAGFASRISELFDDPSLAERLSRNARRAVVARDYTWPRQVDRTAQALAELLPMPLPVPGPRTTRV